MNANGLWLILGIDFFDVSDHSFNLYEIATYVFCNSTFGWKAGLDNSSKVSFVSMEWTRIVSQS